MKGVELQKLPRHVHCGVHDKIREGPGCLAERERATPTPRASTAVKFIVCSIQSNMATPQVISNSGHEEMIHDAGLDYYGRRLATCSSDKTIKIFEIEGESHRLVETLKG
ncbi:hypothetical protein VN97_g4013 [Penicillium thymicola]|uniref:Protein transport protein sec13 n=1 Tax=Penicillium thymicola TaxID=293382 RepID=A0AAI9TLB3_PENTH|nr:hypothetical protein VN97_g4013 [Penicillium thymicola]